MNFFRTTDTTDTTIWKPGLKPDHTLIIIVKLTLKFEVQTPMIFLTLH